MWFTYRHALGSLVVLGDGGGGRTVVLATPRVGQHLMLFAPGHRPVWVLRPRHVIWSTFMHSPPHLPLLGDGGEGGGGLDGGGVGLGLLFHAVRVRQHLMFAAPGQRPVTNAVPTQSKSLTFAHSPLHLALGGGGVGDGVGLVFQPLVPVQHRTLEAPGHFPTRVARLHE